jgi:hypothetical protein
MRVSFGRRLDCALRLRYVFIRAGSAVISLRLATFGERRDEHGIDLLVEPSDYRHQPKQLLSSDGASGLSPGAII